MRVILTILGAVAGLFAALFVADKSVHLARKHVKRYITIEKDHS